VRKHTINRLSSPWLALIIIALVAAVIYSNIYHSPFVFDDTCQIVEKTSIRHLDNYFSFEQLLKPRAIVDLTFALNYKFGKLNVFGYHLVNVFIHILNGFIVYFLALIIFKQLSAPSIPKFLNSSIPKSSIIHPSNFSIFNFQFSIHLMSLFAALIFIAHPIQTQAVTYTVQRYASIAAMFYMASVLFYLKARIEAESSKQKAQSMKLKGESGKIKAESSKLKAQNIKQKAESKNDEGRRPVLLPLSFELSALYSLSILCGMLAFLSKQNTASLPGAILLVEYLFVDRTWQGWKRKIPWFAVAFTLWFLFVLYVSGFFGGSSAGTGLLEDVSDLMQETDIVSRWSYLCTQFNVLVIYIRLLFLPIGQNLDYMYPFKGGFFDGYTSLAFLFLAGIVALGIWNIKKRPVIAFGIFWFFITLSVESSIIPIRDALYEHRLYLVMFGFAVLIPRLIFHFLSTRKMLIATVSVFIIFSLGTATFLRNIVWQNRVSLWSDVVSKSSRNPKGWNNWGNALLKLDKPDDAIEKLKKALNIKPDYVEAWNNWGNALLKLDKPDDAIEKLKKALNIKPDYAEAWNNWGSALVSLGRFEEAALQFKRALKIKPGIAEAWLNWSSVLLDIGKPEEAIIKSKMAIDIMPDYAQAWYRYGNALFKAGKLEESLQCFEKATDMDPLNIGVWNNWGCALAVAGRSDDAIQKFEKALTIDLNHVSSLCNLGKALFLKGQNWSAIEKFKKATSIKPDYVDAWINWGKTLNALKKYDDAVEKYEKALLLNPKMSDVRKRIDEIKKLIKSGDRTPEES